ncbi:MAG TPA: Xaa-Pro peptidase family protein, partial [Bacteroidales bacterium]|nr:Xaa-Pro peptidase family protein [Bacteroidales bacterium]
MFSASVYTERRKELKNLFKNGLLLFTGNTELPMNYPQNAYHFRQDSTFLYFFGLDEPGMAAIIDIDNGKEIIFGDDVDIEDIIWTGPLPLLTEKVKQVGITDSAPFAAYAKYILEAKKQNRCLHFLPPYNPNTKIFLAQLLDIPTEKLKENASMELIQAVIKLRCMKGPEEIGTIEKGMETAYEMFTKAIKMVKPGIYEYEVAGKMEGIARANNGALSFPTILSVRGEILHGHDHSNHMKEGDLLLIDAGFETPDHYATDHTRTVPVSGSFTQKQKEIYQIVLDSQLAAIAAIKPGVKYQEV